MPLDHAATHTRVTVIIPAWGGYSGELLDRAVNSVHRASSQNVYILIVDNANEPPLTLPSCRMVRTDTRLALGAARNLGLRQARSEYVLFLDADDELVPGAIDMMLEELARHAPAHRRPLLVSASLIDPASGTPYHWPYPWMRAMTAHPALFQLLESARPSFPVNGSLIDRRAAASTAGYDNDPTSAEDWTFGVSLAWACCVIPDRAPTLVYAPAPDGVWARNDKFSKHLDHRKCIRRRLRSDDTVAWWLRVLIPLLAVLHTIDACREVTQSRWRSRH